MRDAIERADGVVGPPLEQVVRHEGFATAVAVLQHLRREVGHQVDGLLGHLLHQVNMPTRRDVNRLLAHAGYLERQVRELSNQLDDRHDGEQR